MQVGESDVFCLETSNVKGDTCQSVFVVGVFIVALLYVFAEELMQKMDNTDSQSNISKPMYTEDIPLINKRRNDTLFGY